MSRMTIPGLAIGLIALVVTGCEKGNQFVPPPPPEVTVATPVSREVVDTIEFTGTTRATAKVDLKARISGYLQKIEFEDGQLVKKGDLLFVIEPAPFEAELQSAKAHLQKAEAALQLAKTNLVRVESLYRRNVATQQEYDIQVAERAGAEAEVAVAESAVTQAKLQLSYTKVLAPIGGRIGRHLVDLGNLVQSEVTSLATIESIDPIHAYFYLSEGELLTFMEMLRENKLPDPETTPPTLNLGLANETGFPHVGHLDYRELSVDSDTGTVMRRGVFENEDNLLIPGMFVRIRAELGEPAKKLLVEERAISSDQRGDYLLVVKDDNTVEYRTVRLGIAQDGMRVVEEGLKAEDRVVVNGLQRARPGTEVNPQLSETEISKSSASSPAARTAQKDNQPSPPAIATKKAG